MLRITTLIQQKSQTHADWLVALIVYAEQIEYKAQGKIITNIVLDKLSATLASVELLTFPVQKTCKRLEAITEQLATD